MIEELGWQLNQGWMRAVILHQLGHQQRVVSAMAGELDLISGIQRTENEPLQEGHAQAEVFGMVALQHRAKLIRVSGQHHLQR